MLWSKICNNTINLALVGEVVKVGEGVDVYALVGDAVMVGEA